MSDAEFSAANLRPRRTRRRDYRRLVGNRRAPGHHAGARRLRGGVDGCGAGKKLEALAAAVAGRGADAASVVMDVNDRQSVESAFEEVVNRFGRVDVLVNNAGIAAPQKFLEMTEQAWSRVLETKLERGVAGSGRRRRGKWSHKKTGGSIINIAICPRPGGAAHSGELQRRQRPALFT